jgi:hypothetical protein
MPGGACFPAGVESWRGPFLAARREDSRLRTNTEAGCPLVLYLGQPFISLDIRRALL